jgi:hypothetical protein
MLQYHVTFPTCSMTFHSTVPNCVWPKAFVRGSEQCSRASFRSCCLRPLSPSSSSAVYSTAQHSTAQHSTAQYISDWDWFASGLLKLAFFRRCFGWSGRHCSFLPRPRTLRAYCTVQYLTGQRRLELGHHLLWVAFQRRQFLRACSTVQYELDHYSSRAPAQAAEEAGRPCASAGCRGSGATVRKRRRCLTVQ